MKNRKGSATVLMAMISVSLSMAILSSIIVIRQMTLNSICRSYGNVWTRGILSEYDRHLLRDYGIMGFYGNNPEVAKKLEYYMRYSLSNRLQVRSLSATADLNGYELSEPENFRRAMANSFGTESLEVLLKKEKRKDRGDLAASEKPGNKGAQKTEKLPREIKNPVVLHTLPSAQGESSFSPDSVIEALKSGKFVPPGGGSVKNVPMEIVFMRKYMNSYRRTADGKKHYFRNEWEYVLKGAANDETNLKSCRRRLFLIRNGLNLAYLYKDPEKVEVVTAIAEIISPGPMGVVTQGILMEAWAALESEKDVENLLEGRRVPVMKTAATWNTGIEGILKDEEVQKKLDEDSRKLLKEKGGEVSEAAGKSAGKVVEEGLDYEEYLMIMILVLPEETRLRRLMDLVQINMKYRYYRDFNLAEYYGGVSFAIHVNGKKYAYSREYR